MLWLCVWCFRLLVTTTLYISIKIYTLHSMSTDLILLAHCTKLRSESNGKETCRVIRIIIMMKRQTVSFYRWENWNTMKLDGFSKVLRFADLKCLCLKILTHFSVSDPSQIPATPTSRSLTFIKVFSSFVFWIWGAKAMWGNISLEEGVRTGQLDRKTCVKRWTAESVFVVVVN